MTTNSRCRQGVLFFPLKLYQMGCSKSIYKSKNYHMQKPNVFCLTVTGFLLENNPHLSNQSLIQTLPNCFHFISFSKVSNSRYVLSSWSSSFSSLFYWNSIKLYQMKPYSVRKSEKIHLHNKFQNIRNHTQLIFWKMDKN